MFKAEINKKLEEKSELEQLIVDLQMHIKEVEKQNDVLLNGNKMVFEEFHKMCQEN